MMPSAVTRSRSGRQPSRSTPQPQLLGSLAEVEKSTISERTSTGRDRVARDGRYTGGAAPVSYDVDEQQRLVPSSRLVPELGITGADMVREVLARAASGASTLNKEAGRLSALGIPRRSRYDNGKVIERGNGWGPSSLAAVLHNPT